MRLIHATSDGGFALKEFGEEVPEYAILSHTWGMDEVSFGDITKLSSVSDSEVETEAMAKKGGGWDKIRFCAQQAKRDGLEYLWVDTCCIDKSNGVELTQAINSMFYWYQNSRKCYVFLSDIEGKSPEGDSRPASEWKAAFRASRWFTRGWTLQELIAPHIVEFFSYDGVLLGDKDILKQTIHEITGIPVHALSGSDLTNFSVNERFSWTKARYTTLDEDIVYSMLGMFGCQLPLIYGEGRERASHRLKSQIAREVEVRRWLKAPNPSANHHKAYKQRQAETGLWLLQSEKFKRWREAAASKIWLHGIPGCGKTVLSSIIIEHLLHHYHNDATVATVYFYFDFNEAKKRDPELMFHSLLRQLLDQGRVVPDNFYTLFSSCGNGQQQPSLSVLLIMARQWMRHFTHVYIVLDALDECNQLPELMDILQKMAEWQLNNVHLLMTSRRERGIQMPLESLVSEDSIVCVERGMVDNDILEYVKKRLPNEPRLSRLGNGMEQEIETAIMNRAQGMYARHGPIRLAQANAIVGSEWPYVNLTRWPGVPLNGSCVGH